LWIIIQVDLLQKALPTLSQEDNMSGNRLLARFWGVRGSIPSPLTGSQVEDKIVRAVMAMHDNPLPKDADEAAVREVLHKSLPFHHRSTFGGNTPCVEVRCDDELIILDMGSGLRPLGMSLLSETFKNKGLSGTILQSHVHWDHIQGYPFWPHVHMPRTVFDNHFTFYGGRKWDRSLEEVLRGQMTPPVFPIEHDAIKLTGLRMSFAAVWDGWKTMFAAKGDDGRTIKVNCRALHHPQETYGYRIEYCGKVIAYTTDHEPYGGDTIHQPLLDLVQGADVWITDCQYSYDEYAGKTGGPQKTGWGHAYPEYVATVAREAQPKLVVTFHHDPVASDEHIVNLAQSVEDLSGISTQAAYEGLELAA